MANNKTRLSFPFQNAQPLLQILPQHTGLTTLAEAVSLLIGHGEEEDIFCVSTVPEILRFCVERMAIVGTIRFDVVQKRRTTVEVV
jgi:hypothetical protein